MYSNLTTCWCVAGNPPFAGTTAVQKDAAGAGDAFKNAVISLNRVTTVNNGPGAQFVFKQGTQICLPNFFGPSSAPPDLLTRYPEH